jgi:hypothetical protein
MWEWERKRCHRWGQRIGHVGVTGGICTGILQGNPGEQLVRSQTQASRCTGAGYSMNEFFCLVWRHFRHMLTTAIQFPFTPGDDGYDATTIAAFVNF